MIVRTPHGRVVLTEHALKRFRQRVGLRGGEVVAALQEASVQPLPPNWMSVKSAREHAEHNDGYLVTARWACPFRGPREGDRDDDFEFLVTTCMVRKRRSKAEVRALRELAREEASWTA